MNESKKNQIIGTGIAVGCGFGVALGLVLMTILDHPGFFALGIAVGVSLGTTISLALADHS